jgi:transposase-like protein
MVDELIQGARVSRNGRKYFTSEEKATIVSAWEQSGMSAAEFCRRHELVVNVLYRWRKAAIRGAAMSIRHDGELYTRAEIEALRKENDELKKALAEAEIDKRILKKKLELDARKRVLSRSV